jgi:hypothetical protein
MNEINQIGGGGIYGNYKEMINFKIFDESINKLLNDHKKELQTNNSIKDIIFVRHGISESNELNKPNTPIQGWTHPFLTNFGRLQAYSYGKDILHKIYLEGGFKNIKFYCSVLPRACETAQLITQGFMDSMNNMNISYDNEITLINGISELPVEAMGYTIKSSQRSISQEELFYMRKFLNKVNNGLKLNEHIVENSPQGENHKEDNLVEELNLSGMGLKKYQYMTTSETFKSFTENIHKIFQGDDCLNVVVVHGKFMMEKMATGSILYNNDPLSEKKITDNDLKEYFKIAKQTAYDELKTKQYLLKNKTSFPLITHLNDLEDVHNIDIVQNGGGKIVDFFKNIGKKIGIVKNPQDNQYFEDRNMEKQLNEPLLQTHNVQTHNAQTHNVQTHNVQTHNVQTQEDINLPVQRDNIRKTQVNDNSNEYFIEQRDLRMYCFSLFYVLKFIKFIEILKKNYQSIVNFPIEILKILFSSVQFMGKKGKELTEILDNDSQKNTDLGKYTKNLINEFGIIVSEIEETFKNKYLPENSNETFNSETIRKIRDNETINSFKLKPPNLSSIYMKLKDTEKIKSFNELLSGKQINYDENFTREEMMSLTNLYKFIENNSYLFEDSIYKFNDNNYWKFYLLLYCLNADFFTPSTNALKYDVQITRDNLFLNSEETPESLKNIVSQIGNNNILGQYQHNTKDIINSMDELFSRELSSNQKNHDYKTSLQTDILEKNKFSQSSIGYNTVKKKVRSLRKNASDSLSSYFRNSKRTSGGGKRRKRNKKKYKRTIRNKKKYKRTIRNKKIHKKINLS